MSKIISDIVGQDDGQVKIAHVLGAFDNIDGMRFVEVGANDGISNDPLYKYVTENEWTGILIEPVDKAFRKLKENYASISDRLIFENIAISETPGHVEMWVSKAHQASSILPDVPKRTGKCRKVEVPCSPLFQVMEKHDFYDIDCLCIDAEAYDFRVLKTFPFDKCKPAVIHYEHRHFDDKEKKECENFLKDMNYDLYFNRNNTIAVLGI